MNNWNFETRCLRFYGVHRLGQNLGSKNHSIVQIALFLVIFLKSSDRSYTVFTGGVSLVCGIVTWRIRAVKLETANAIESCIHKRYTEWSWATELSVLMLIIAKELNQLLNIDWRVHWVQMLLRMKTTIINEEVSVGDHSWNWAQHMIIHLVQLSTLSCRNEQFWYFFLLSGKNDTYTMMKKLSWYY